MMNSLQINERKMSDQKANTSKSGSRLIQPKSLERQGTNYSAIGPVRPVDGFDSRDLSSKRKYSRLQDNMNLLNSNKGIPHPSANSNRVSSLGSLNRNAIGHSIKTSRKNSVETRRTSHNPSLRLSDINASIIHQQDFGSSSQNFHFPKSANRPKTDLSDGQYDSNKSNNNKSMKNSQLSNTSRPVRVKVP